MRMLCQQPKWTAWSASPSVLLRAQCAFKRRGHPAPRSGDVDGGSFNTVITIAAIDERPFWAGVGQDFHLLASLLQILFSVRSERQLMEQMQYNLLFRWFVGHGIADVVWVPTVFTKNRDRLLTTEMSRKVMAANPSFL
jgi:hypothetical protein